MARLSAASTEVVRATLPVIGAAISDITPVFYRRLFAAHPELIRDLFNRGNQAQGDQQRALAGSIAAYATLLVAEDGPEPESVLARIAHKHASLGVTEEQYPIVHEHLFAAIVEVLGDAVTPEIATAWDEVYWNMAHALIAVEKGLYEEQDVKPGDVWRNVEVVAKVTQTSDTVTFVVTSTDGSPLPASKPGQYLSVGVRLPDGARQIRQYSLIGAPSGQEESTAWAFSVKRVPAADGIPAGEVSNFLHDHVTVGDVLEATTPYGELTLTEEGPLVLVSAGIGVTPMLGFLRHLDRIGSEREVVVLHADRAEERHAHRAEVAELVAALPAARQVRWYEELAGEPVSDELLLGRIDLSEVALPLDATAYLCGPVPFMAVVKSSLIERGVPAERVRYEVFGPARELEA
ncbi:MAG: globin domain-containing protein [Nocardioides sp.]